MKELSIEEKAKAYEEVLALMQDCIPDENGLVHIRPEDIFPKLAESKDEKIRKWLICTLKSLNNSPVQIDGAYEMMLPAIDWLKRQGEQKPAWSEEDENRINRLIAYFEDKESFTAEDDVVYANWLKSLRPQNTWKPSDEQMDMLKIAVSTSNSIVLDSLYNDLKKLREE